MEIFKKKIPTKDELYIKDIVKSYLENNNIDIKINPALGEYYLINREKQVSILLNHGIIEISNHKYLYKRQISASFSDGLIKMVNKKIEENCVGLKKELFHNEIDLLRTILKQ
jgi:hypothetical protein